MCGFCGVLGPADRAGADDVAAMNQALAHRGPDDTGSWRQGFAVRRTDHVVVLGHRRLSIIDLSPLGHQPMASIDGALTIAFNGEIYNYRDLRAELLTRGARFRSETDTEVILEAYRAWGTDCLARLNGMFAFALWDARSERLLLARDPLGIKPLYYRFSHGVLSFGSELRALRQHRGFDPTIDRGALGRFLRHGFVVGPETIYAGTQRLLPGDFLTWERGEIAVDTFWRLTDPLDTPLPHSYAEAVGALEALLGDAVERQMIADVPLGAFLSGGVDSSTVVALMQERAKQPVRTFSIGFENRAYNEAPHARAVAKHLGTMHTELVVTRTEAHDVALQLPDLYDEPFADASAIPTTLLSRMTRHHVTVALSGDGGDELFGGYRQYRRFQQLRPWMRLPLPFRRALRAAAPLVPHFGAANALRHLGSSDAAELACSLVSEYEPALLEGMTGPEGAKPPQLFLDTFRAAPASDEVRRAMFADARVYMPDDILVKVDRASMSVALEARVPILDYRVVRLALALPLEWIWKGGVTKAPLREILYRHVPRELIDRPKQGFGMPIDSLLTRELAIWEARYLDPRRLAEEGNLDPAGVQRFLADVRRRPAPRVRAEGVWRLLCFQRWFARNHRGEALDS